LIALLFFFRKSTYAHRSSKLNEMRNEIYLVIGKISILFSCESFNILFFWYYIFLVFTFLRCHLPNSKNILTLFLPYEMFVTSLHIKVSLKNVLKNLLSKSFNRSTNTPSLVGVIPSKNIVRRAVMFQWMSLINICSSS